MAKVSTTPAPVTAEPDLSELLDAKAKLDAQIAGIQKANRAQNITKAREFCAKHGLTAADVFPGASASKSTGKRQIAKPAPKYRNAATGETWSGRGFMAKWLREAVKAGAKKEDFLVGDEAL